jgi:hypothetical protein
MAYMISGANRLIGKPIVGDGSCALLVQQIAKLPNHRFWRQGVRAVEQQNIWPGTAIATFENGVYANDKTGNHVAFFLRFGRRNSDGTAASIWIVEQYHGLKRIQQREISRHGQVDSKWGKRWKNPSNNADAFYVIE